MQIITKNGNVKVTINRASWADMNILKQEALKCIDVNNFNFSVKSEADFINACFELVIKAETSDSFNKALFKCLRNCLYEDSISITEQLFEDKPELIEDYYEIASNCVEVNLRPFFNSLITEFKRRLASLTSDDQNL